jgi:signal transduction histidine kinase
VSVPSADLVLAIAFPLVGLLVIAHQPRNLVGWLLLICSTMGPYLLAGQYALRTADSPTPVTGLATWYSVWGFAPYFVLWALTPMHFPDGELPGPRWRWVRAGLVALLATLVLARMFAPVDSDVSPGLANPIGVAGAGWLNVVTLASAVSLAILGGIAGALAVVQRSRRTRGAERRALRWLQLGVAWLVTANVVNLALTAYGHGSDLLFALGMLGLVVALGVGVIRHQLFDVGAGLRRSLVNAVLVGLLGVAAIAILGAAGAGPQPERLALVAVAVAALLAAAAHDQLQRVVDRLVFGQRQDPQAVLSTLRRRLDLATGPMDALRQLAHGLRETLRLPYVRVEPSAPALAAVSSGTATVDVLELPARESGTVLGRLVVGRRSAGSRFNRRERRALEAVADQVGTLLRQAELSAELQARREELVTTREDERRRLRRDLHDGIGPSLAGIAMQLDRLAGRLTDHPELAARAEAARDDLRRTVTSVRRIVDGLRPPALDDVGLRGALTQLTGQYESRARLCSPPDLPDLPAATEAAAYLIAGEALTNAMRHSSCRRCDVEVTIDHPWLVVTVTDDGTGIPEAARAGVGLTSMRDRAAEAGGLLEVTATAAGTTVRTHLPLGSRA